MKVYVVVENYHSYGDEWEEIIGVFRSEEKAEDAIQKELGNEKYRRWRYTIMEKELE